MKKTLGKRIKEARRVRGWTQARLAEKLGISQPNISDWERGKKSPRVTMLPRIYRVLKLSRVE